jgi:hypothetical protein
MSAAAGGHAAGADGEPAGYGFREAPRFLPLFAPRAHREDYRAFVSPQSLDRVLVELTNAPQLQHAPGSWTAVASAPTDAFGEAGTYDRFRLLRLYGATRTRVAHGPRVGPDGQVIEAWTLVSPYPSPDLSRLEPGTLLLVLRIAER